MRKVIYAALILLSLLIPLKSLDIAKLEPVEAIAVEVKAGEVYLRTDTDEGAKGETVALALGNLKENADGIIYLDTARYLLVGENAQSEAEEMKRYMRSNVVLAPYDGEDVAEETRRLDAHERSKKPWG